MESTEDFIQPRRAHDVNRGRLHPHPSKPLRGRPRGRQVPVGELADRIPQPVIKIPRRYVAAVKVGQGAPRGHRRQRCGHGLDPVAQHEHEVAFTGLQRLGDAHHAAPQAQRLVERVIIARLHQRPRENGPAFALHLAPSVAQIRQEMHAGDDDLEFQVRVGVNGAQNGAEQAVFRARAGHDRDAALSSL